MNKIISYDQQKSDSEKSEFIKNFCAATEQLRESIKKSSPPSLKNSSPSPFTSETIEKIFKMSTHYLKPSSFNAWIAYEQPENFTENLGEKKYTATLFSNIRSSDEKMAYFSLVEGVTFKEVGTLFSIAEKWMTEKGAEKSIGPICLNTFLPYRVRKEKEITRSFSWEPNIPSVIREHMIQAGYKPSLDYHSTALEGMESLISGSKKGFLSAESLGYTYEFQSELQKKDLTELYDITMSSFSKNDFFDPIPYALFETLYLEGKNKNELPYFVWAKDESGKKVGYFLAFIDEEFIIWKSLAVLPEHHGKGLASFMMYVLSEKAHQNGFKHQIAALIRSGNKSEFAEKKQTVLWKNEYELLEKNLIK